MKYINTNNGLRSAGHYSQGIIYKDLIFLSGQFSIDSITGDKKYGTIEQETQQILSNIESILTEAGSSKEKVLKVTLFISDISLWSKIDEVYSIFFGEHKPARSIVPVGELHYGFKVEIEAIAAID